MAYRKQFQTSKREAYRLENYKGKNPMSISQWRRHQRIKKAERELASKDIEESSSNKFFSSTANSNKPLVSRKLFSSEEKVTSEKVQKNLTK